MITIEVAAIGRQKKAPMPNTMVSNTNESTDLSENEEEEEARNVT